VIASHPQRRGARGPWSDTEPQQGGQTKLGPAAGWIGLGLALASIVAYAGCLQNGFVNFDDDRYVAGNPRVQQGICLEGILWALTTSDVSNWHPLTWLSYELDAALFGLKASGYHATNVLLHCTNTLLLFLLLGRMTGAVGRSAVVAGFFALHPLHVESVAWISERKDVLSGLFFLLTLRAYHHYALIQGWRRYLVVVCMYALGLAAKPMLVTLPFVLLLIDYWPLRRVQPRRWLLAEKGPLLAMSLASCIVTYQVQRQSGAVQTADQLPITGRLANAPIAYVEYLAKTIWPAGLAVYYPHPHDTTPLGQAALAATFLVIVTCGAVLCRRRAPYLAVGWLWWLGMLVPVIGLVQVGGQAYADRYMYLPMIGLLIAAAWGGQELAVRLGTPAWLMGGLVTVLLVGCGLATRRQISYWRDGVSLWQHALDVTSPNPVAFNGLGVALAETGQPGEAVDQFKQGLAIEPDDERCHQNLALALVALGRFEESLEHFERVLRVNPRNVLAQFNAGVLTERNGRHDVATERFRRALDIDPNYWRAHLQLGRLLLKTGERQLGEQHLNEALRLNPSLIKNLPSRVGGP
jgi:lipoprotein NlpI